MKKLKDSILFKPVSEIYRDFKNKHLDTKEKRRKLAVNLGSTLASAAFGAGVMFTVKALAVAAVSTALGASTAFTAAAAIAAGAPIAAVLVPTTIVAGLVSGVLANRSTRKAMALSGQKVPKFWSKENRALFFSKGNLLTMGLSAGAALIGGLIVADVMSPSSPSDSFNRVASGPITPMPQTVDPAVSAVAPEASATAPVVAPAPEPATAPVAAAPVAEAKANAAHAAKAPVAKPHLAPLGKPIIIPDAEKIATLYDETTLADKPVAEIVAPAAEAVTPEVAPLPPLAEPVAVDPAPVASVVADTPAAASISETVGQKVGECRLEERLSGFYNETSLPNAKLPPNVYDMKCEIAQSAKAGDFIEVKGEAEYGKKFASTITMEWNTVRDLMGQAKMWIAPQMENRINEHLYNGMAKVVVNPSFSPMH